MANPYLKAALITAAIVLLGFFFIGQLDAMRANELRGSVDELLAQSETERLLFLYAQTMNGSKAELCEYFSGTAGSRADRAYSLAEKIQYYEQSNLMNADYTRIRDQYYLSNAALYLNLRAAEEYCGKSDYVTVLFFYRISPECPECKAQGGALDNLRAKYPGVRVFAFPVDTSNPVVKVLLKRHGIASAPAIVIGSHGALFGLQNEEKLAGLVKAYANG